LEYVGELLSERAVEQAGCFKPEAVSRLAAKAASGAQLTEVEDMALVGILSTQLIDQMFVRGPRRAIATGGTSRLRLIDRVGLLS